MSSTNPSQIQTREALLTRVSRVAASARAGIKAASSVPEKDPNEKGTVTPPLHPSESTTNSRLPGSNGSANGPATPGPETTQQGAEGVLKAEVPSTIDGNAKDDAVTSSTAKIAAQAKSIGARLLTLTTKKADDTPKGDSSKVPAAVDPTDKGEVKPSEKEQTKNLPPAGTVNGAAPQKDGTAPEPEAKEKSANDFTLGADALIKLAQVMISTEEGLAAATYHIKKAKGAEFAQKAIDSALQSQAIFDKRASEEAQAAAVVDNMIKGASAQDLQLMEKFANVHETEFSRILDQTEKELQTKIASVTDEAGRQALIEQGRMVFEMKKRAYAEGASEAADMADSGQIQGGGEEITPEDILAVIQHGVESKEIQPELAQQLIQEIMQSEGGEGAEAGGEPDGDEGAMPPAEGGEEAPPAEGQAPTAGAPDTAKAASDRAAGIAAFVGAGAKQASAETKEAAALLNILV